MSKSELQAVIAKVRKLLARGDAKRNDNEHEREIAIRQAHALMARHGLATADVDAAERAEGEGPLGKVEGVIGNTVWRRAAYAAAARLNGCYCYYSDDRIVLVGRQARVEVARLMGAYVVDSIEREYAGWARRARPARGAKNSFGLGATREVSATVSRILEEQERGRVDGQQYTGSQALVLVESHRNALVEAKRAAEKMTGSKFRSGTRGHARNYSAYAAGREAGAGISLNPQIGGAKAGVRRLT